MDLLANTVQIDHHDGHYAHAGGGSVWVIRCYCWRTEATVLSRSTNFNCTPLAFSQTHQEGGGHIGFELTTFQSQGRHSTTIMTKKNHNYTVFSQNKKHFPIVLKNDASELGAGPVARSKPAFTSRHPSVYTLYR